MGAVSFLVVLSICLGAAAWLFFLWAARSGQYDDVEGPKYRMLDDEEDEGGIGSGEGAGGAPPSAQAPKSVRTRRGSSS